MSLERTKVISNCTTVGANVTNCVTYNVTIGPPVDAVVEYWEYVNFLNISISLKMILCKMIIAALYLLLLSKLDLNP